MNGRDAERLAGKDRARARSWGGTYEAEVVAVDGGVHVVIRDYDGGRHRFGPCRYQPPLVAAGGDPHGHQFAVPPAGTRCLVVFADGDVARPWIVTFGGWPS